MKILYTNNAIPGRNISASLSKNFLTVKILILSLLILASCNKKGKDSGIESKINLLDRLDYFPLHLGNHWDIGSYSLTIDSLKIINGISYYRAITAGGEWGNYRKTADGKVYIRSYIYSSQNEEVLNFDLAASEGYTWTFITNQGGSGRTWHATLISKHETVKVGNHTFKNCYKYYFDADNSIDEEHIIWLAPGPGQVKIAIDGIGPTYDGGQILTRVKISGVEIDFR